MKISLSIILPVYNESENLEKLIPELISVMDSLQKNYEIIFVDDGSKDKSADVINKYSDKNPQKIKLIELLTNYGQTAAIVAGLDNSCGELIVLMDADLQNDVNDIPAMLKKIEEGYDIVSGWRRKRNDPFFSKRLPSLIANKIIAFLTKIKIHDFGCTLKIYKRKYIDPQKIYGEMHRFLPIYGHIDGAKICEMEVKHHSRKFGKSKYGIMRSFKVILDLVTVKFLITYFQKPMYFFGFWGIVFLFAAILAGAYTLIDRYIRNIPGVLLLPLVLLTMFFVMMGINFILMGVLAEMIMRNYYGNTARKIYKLKNAKNE